ncbi:uncharacterized protein LOC108025080 [Drosophila biarmipes]|uniref:uncharacterized protein LOC108025080 n=1 Tax=Drosophila biarmipes TaxID=125945 RepID=UPI0007E8A9BC|nr:uncharacterized protein LOC108025080 [Drosophila biarmipes]
MLARRKWTPSEEDRFIDIWLHNLHLFIPGRKLTYIYSELELYYREVGLEINAQGIKSKMETLKRKYYSMLYSDNEDQSTAWKHFDTMALIVAGSNKEGTDTEWKDYTQPAKTSRSSRSSVYMDEGSQTQSEYEGNFNSVFLDEGSVNLFNEEEKPQPKRVRRRYSNTSRIRVKPRRIWTTADESQFVDVWEKFGVDLQSDRTKMDVYKDMQRELDELGIKIMPNDIKSKIESLTRTFRAHQHTVGDQSEWIHYPKVNRILTPIDFSKLQNFFDDSSSEEDSEWFKKMEPKETEPETCSEPPNSTDSVDNKIDVSREPEPEVSTNCSNSNDSVVNQFDCSSQPSSPESSIEFSMVESNPRRCEVSIEILDEEEAVKPLPSPPLEKLKAAEDFSQFVTKELAVLNDDLLIEAKRQIYNIICGLQMKQNELNKKSKLAK